MAKYEINDVEAIEVVDGQQVVGFAVLLQHQRWAAINVLAPNGVLVGVFGNAKDAYDAIVKSEDAIQHAGKP